MFQKFLLLFPYFQRLEKQRQQIADRREELIREEIAWNREVDEWTNELRRRENIRQSLLENQSFLRLRVSRQTF